MTCSFFISWVDVSTDYLLKGTPVISSDARVRMLSALTELTAIVNELCVFSLKPGNVRYGITQTCATGSISNVHFTAKLIIVTAVPLRPRKGMHHDN